MKKYTTMKQSDFDTIKQLHDLKLTGKQIQELTGRSNGVVCNVKRSNTFAEYQAIGRGYRIKPVVTSLPVAESSQPLESDLIKQLKEINSNLVLLTAAWNAQPTKKRLF